MGSSGVSTSRISDRRQNARRTAAADYEKRRASLLSAAADVFKEMGYGAATVDDIARRAEMDRASVYYYFSGKKDLFREMVGDATRENVEMAERTARLDCPPREKLRRVIHALFESYQRHYPYLYVYVQEDMSRLAQDRSAWSKGIIALNRRFDAAMLSIVQDGLSSGEFVSSGDAKVISAGVVGMCNWSHRWFDPAGPYRPAQVADAFAEMVLGGLIAR